MSLVEVEGARLRWIRQRRGLSMMELEESRSTPRDHREARESSSTRAARNGMQGCQDLGGEAEELLVRKQEARLLYPVPQELQKPEHVLVLYKHSRRVSPTTARLLLPSLEADAAGIRTSVVAADRVLDLAARL